MYYNGSHFFPSESLENGCQGTFAIGKSYGLLESRSSLC